VKRGVISGRCQVCRHDEQARMELMLAGKQAIRRVAAKFAVNRDALRRHWLRHVTDEHKAALVAGPEIKIEEFLATAADENTSLLDHYRTIRLFLYDSFIKASDLGDRQSVSFLAGRLHENLAAMGKLTGDLASYGSLNVTNIFLSPQFSELQLALIEALRPYPDARAAVVAAFRDIEARAAAAPHRHRCRRGPRR
jgi:hypothetical protein